MDIKIWPKFFLTLTVGAKITSYRGERCMLACVTRPARWENASVLREMTNGGLCTMMPAGRVRSQAHDLEERKIRVATDQCQ